MTIDSLRENLSKLSINEIVDHATDGQVVRWYEAICENRWPEDMPMPWECFEVVWHKVMKRAINVLPPKKDLK